MSEAITVNKVRFSYGDIAVLQDVSFSVNRGEFCVIIGPNGSGKTTLLKVVNGLEKIQAGNVAIGNRPLASYSPRALARITSLVPQSPPEDCPFTVRETVLMGRAPHLGLFGLEGPLDNEVANIAMAFTRVDHLADRPLEHLSGGELKRVLIARAICQEPEIMLLDEPTAALDLSHQVRVMDLMERLCREKGTTVVMVSHDLNLAAMYGDRLVLLKEGRVLRQGIASDVLTFETLEEAYGCVLLAEKSPLGNFPRITSVPGRYLDTTRR